VLVSHRTALEYNPGPDDEIQLTTTTNRTVTYPGLTLRFIRGPGARTDDPPFMTTLRASSRARAFLENLSTSRPTTRNRVLPMAEIEKRLEGILHVEGEQGLNALRDHAREVSESFGWHRELTRLDAVIGALLQTRPGTLTSAVGLARSQGEPFDAACLARLQLLFAALKSRGFERITDASAAPDHHRNKAFFEAYFSNYIEGTTFEIEEAEQIVFDRIIPADRPRDSHDILGTFEIVSDQGEMACTISTFDDYLTLLKQRHGRMLAQRPEANPGVFKDRPNRAGETHFVDPDYVLGTLRKGFELMQELERGLPRAIFQMFLVSDVHPFVDGNGRTARIMMNAELVAAGVPTIIIPTVYRDDYLGALRALTRRDRPATIIDALVKAQRFSNLTFAPYQTILAELQRRNWFKEPDAARIVS